MPKPAVGTPEWGGTLNDFLDTLQSAATLDTDVGSLIGLPGSATAVAVGAELDAKASKAANLSDLGSATTARNNLGLGTAATQSSGAFDAAGAAVAAQAAAIAASIPIGQKGAALGVATLDGSDQLVENVLASKIVGGIVQPGDQLFSLMDPVFAAVGDGVSDDSASVQAWINALVASRAFAYVPAGYAPPGFYKLGSQITADVGPEAKFAFGGGGTGVTQFIVPDTNTTGGFYFDATGTPRDVEIAVNGFSIVAQGLGCGTAFAVEMTVGGAQHQRSVTMTDVRIYGENIAEDYFDISASFIACHRPLLNNVILGGPFGPGVADDMTDGSPQYTATTALVLDDAYAWELNQCYIWAAHTGISDVGTDAEGGRLINSHVVGCRVGFYRFRSSPEPGLRVSGCHFNNRDDNIKINGGKVIWIDHCHIYNQDVDDEYTGNPRDIAFDNVERANVHDCYFEYPGHTGRICIFVDGGVLANYINIHDNIINADVNIGIQVGTSATNVIIKDNLYPGTFATKRVQDNSGAASIRDYVSGIYRVSSQNVGAGAGPVQQWKRDSTSPAANDLMTRFSFLGNDSAGNETEYAALQTKINSPTNGSEAAAIQLYAFVNGALTEVLEVGPAAAGATGLKVLGNRAGVLTIDDVTHGATDSGGSGYKLLRVPN